MFLGIISILGASILGINSLFGVSTEPTSLARLSLSLSNRYPDSFVNEVFKDNILLTLAYAAGNVQNPQKIDWDTVRKPFHFEFTLPPQQTFAFHQDVLEKYKNRIKDTTHAHFNYQDGFRNSGYLYGDGVCHLASFLDKVSRQAGLLVEAPTNHDFRTIPDIEREYGVSIYYNPGSSSSNSLQNLYITNNRNKTLIYSFDYDGKNLKVAVFEEQQ